jgi:hypothetical protein
MPVTTLGVRSTILDFEFQMHVFPTAFAETDSSRAPKVIHGPSVHAIHRTASHFARIHAGVPGESIPHEVMEFYRAANGGDRYRPRMVKEAVLGIKNGTGMGIEDRTVLVARHSERMTKFANARPKHLLKAWFEARPTLHHFISDQTGTELERWRMAYLSEAMEIFDVTFDYIESLTAYDWKP